MSQPLPPFVPPPGPPQPAPDQVRRKRLMVALFTLGGLVALLMLGLAVVGAASLIRRSDTPVAVAPKSGLPAAPFARDAPSPFPSPTPGVTPKAEEFHLTAKITDKQCFGSAGCNIQFKIDVAYGGVPLDTATTWAITYEVNGVEDGPQIGTLELTGTTFDSKEGNAQTKNKDSKIDVKVTRVEKVGI